jgi:Trp operon repressor
MTRKDYELIARSIFVDREKLINTMEFPLMDGNMPRAELSLVLNAVDVITRGLADQLEAMNPRFNRYLFLDKCMNG